MKNLFFLLFFLIQTIGVLPAQNAKLLSGPMLGNVSHRNAELIIEIDKPEAEIRIEYEDSKANDLSKTKIIRYKAPNNYSFYPVRITLDGLSMGSTIHYSIFIDGVRAGKNIGYVFNTKDIWEWRKPAPDFSFLIGSCAFINDSLYDRPGKPYGAGTSIFETMGNVPSDFMVWLGDNVYYRESDYTSDYGMQYRNAMTRRLPQISELFSSRPNFAIWDDHDFGPNNSDFTFGLKSVSLDIFNSWWANPSSVGTSNYTSFSWSDCAFFLLDDRYFRSPNEFPDSINDKPNPEKHFFGKEQMEWLKASLVSSTAPFKFLICGNQVTNTFADKECMQAYTAEWLELKYFIEDQKIPGVIFISGDRHFTELLKTERRIDYPLYELTCSPLSSGSFDLTKTPEGNNPLRVSGTLICTQNYCKLSITGNRDNRILSIQCFNASGNLLWEKTITQKEISY
jgi:alkaline phosphatase D